MGISLKKDAPYPPSRGNPSARTPSGDSSDRQGDFSGKDVVQNRSKVNLRISYLTNPRPRGWPLTTIRLHQSKGRAQGVRVIPFDPPEPAIGLASIKGKPSVLAFAKS